MDKSLKNIGAAYQEINEETKPRRGWNHMKKIDELLAWMYTKNILTKGEKAQKDSLFRQYYRYYNDSDYPRLLVSKGISKWQPKDIIERHLEMALDDFVKRILAKYMPNIDRTAFRLDMAASSLESLKSACASLDAYAIINYYAKKIKGDSDERETLLGQVDELKVIYTQLRINMDAASPENKNYTASWARTKMQKSGKWTPALEDEYQKMAKFIKTIEITVIDLETAITKAKMALEQ